MTKYGSRMLCLLCVMLMIGCNNMDQSQQDASIGRLPAPHLKRLSQNQYGIDLNSRSIVQASFAENQFLTDILTAHNVAAETIDKLAKKSIHIFDVRRMRAGNAFTLVKGNGGQVDYFIYEKNPADYVVFDLRDSVNIYEGRNKTNAEEKEISGVIESSLYETVAQHQIDTQLAELLEDVFAWSMDLFHLEKGDFFKAIYKEEYVDDVSLGITQILAAQFHHDGKDYYAFRYGKGNEIRYLDQFGNDVKTTFLQAPNTYNFHPTPGMLSGAKEEKDLSPVFAVGAGTLSYKRIGEAYELRIGHTYPYTTRYTGLKELNQDMIRGSRIKKGTLLGYAESPTLSLDFLRRKRTIDKTELYTDLKNIPSESGKDSNDFEIMKENMILRLARIPLSKREKKLLSSFR